MSEVKARGRLKDGYRARVRLFIECEINADKIKCDFMNGGLANIDKRRYGRGEVLCEAVGRKILEVGSATGPLERAPATTGHKLNECIVHGVWDTLLKHEEPGGQ